MSDITANIKIMIFNKFDEEDGISYLTYDAYISGEISYLLIIQEKKDLETWCRHNTL